MSDDGFALRRILVTRPGELARRLCRLYRSLGIESVAAFSIAEADAAWVGDADFDAYLGDGEADAVWSDPARLVAAAMDAGCEAIHPGHGRLAEGLDLYAAAAAANVAVIGSDVRRVAEVLDRARLHARARRLGIPLLPASDPLPSDADGIEEAARIGVPLYVRAVHGPAHARADDFAALGAALAAVRSADPSVVLEKALDRGRRIGTVLAADAHGTAVHLGELVTVPGGEQMGPDVLPAELHRQLGEWSVRLARESGVVGVARVRWLLAPDGRPFLLGLAPRLPLAYDLCEAVQGIDLVHAQHVASVGGSLADWSQSDAAALSRHGVQVRVLHRGGAGAIGALELPAAGEDLGVVTSYAEGEPVPAGADRVLAKLTATGPDADACRRRLRAALAATRVEGVETNLGELTGAA